MSDFNLTCMMDLFPVDGIQQGVAQYTEKLVGSMMMMR